MCANTRAPRTHARRAHAFSGWAGRRASEVINDASYLYGHNWIYTFGTLRLPHRGSEHAASRLALGVCVCIVQRVTHHTLVYTHTRPHTTGPKALTPIICECCVCVCVLGVQGTGSHILGIPPSASARNMHRTWGGKFDSISYTCMRAGARTPFLWPFADRSPQFVACYPQPARRSPKTPK